MPNIGTLNPNTKLSQSEIINHCERLVANLQADMRPIKDMVSGNGKVINYGKRFGIDVSVNLSEIMQRLTESEKLIGEFEENYLFFGDSKGNAIQDDELSWDNVNKILSTTQILLSAGATITEFSTDVLLAGNSDVAVPTEKAVKTYSDVIEASAVLINGSRELTANWNAGNFKITAGSMELTTGDLVLNTGYVDSKAYYYVNGTKFISIDGTENLMVGEGAGNGGLSTGGTHIGYHAGMSTILAGVDNINIGVSAGQAQTSALGCINVGGLSGYSNVSSPYNVNIGYRTGYNNIAGYCVFIGYNSGQTQNSALSAHNIGIGYNTLSDNISGKWNIAIGSSAGRACLGDANTYIGYSGAAQSNSGSYATIIGAAACLNNVGSVSDATVIGGQACNKSVGPVSTSTIIGAQACFSATGTISQATVIGAYARYYSSSVTGGVNIGYFAGARETASNRLYIDDRYRGATEALGRTSALVYGVFSATVANQIFRINGTIELYQNNLYMKWGAGGDSGIKDSGSHMVFDADVNSAGSRQFQFNNGVALFSDKVAFTQSDLNEYIDSLTDGYLDVGFTTAFRFNAAVNIDVRLEFVGTSNTGVLEFLEDEDVFLFSDDVYMTGSEKIGLRDVGIGIYSQADGYGDMFADTGWRIGDSSAGAPTNYTHFEPDGALVFVGTAGLCYAEIYASDVNDTITITIAGKANKVQITSFVVDGESNNMTPDHTNDHITVVKAGHYLCNVSMHIQSDSAGGADSVGYSVYKNNGNTEFSNLHGQRNLSGGGGDEGSVSLSGVIDLLVSDTIEVWIWNNDSTDDIVVDDINLSLIQIGGI